MTDKQKMLEQKPGSSNQSNPSKDTVPRTRSDVPALTDDGIAIDRSVSASTNNFANINEGGTVTVQCSSTMTNVFPATAEGGTGNDKNGRMAQASNSVTKRHKRSSCTTKQTEVLTMEYIHNTHPDFYRRAEIAHATGLTEKQVKNWFEYRNSRRWQKKNYQYLPQKRKQISITQDLRGVLETEFRRNNNLDPLKQEEIARDTGLTHFQISTWFGMKRARLKRKSEGSKRSRSTSKSLSTCNVGWSTMSSVSVNQRIQDGTPCWRNPYTGSIPLSQLREQQFVNPNAGQCSRHEAEVRDQSFVLNYCREINGYGDRASELEVRTEDREEDPNRRVHQSECRNLPNSATGPQQVEVKRRPFVFNGNKMSKQNQGCSSHSSTSEDTGPRSWNDVPATSDGDPATAQNVLTTISDIPEVVNNGTMIVQSVSMTTNHAPVMDDGGKVVVQTVSTMTSDVPAIAYCGTAVVQSVSTTTNDVSTMPCGSTALQSVTTTTTDATAINDGGTTIVQTVPTTTNDFPAMADGGTAIVQNVSTLTYDVPAITDGGTAILQIVSTTTNNDTAMSEGGPVTAQSYSAKAKDFPAMTDSGAATVQSVPTTTKDITNMTDGGVVTAHYGSKVTNVSPSIVRATGLTTDHIKACFTNRRMKNKQKMLEQKPGSSNQSNPSKDTVPRSRNDVPALTDDETAIDRGVSMMTNNFAEIADGGTVTVQCSSTMSNVSLATAEGGTGNDKSGRVARASNSVTKRHKRTPFTAKQKEVLTLELIKDPFLPSHRKAEIARRTKLTERQVRNWFEYTKRKQWYKENKQYLPRKLKQISITPDLRGDLETEFRRNNNPDPLKREEIARDTEQTDVQIKTRFGINRARLTKKSEGSKRSRSTSKSLSTCNVARSTISSVNVNQRVQDGTPYCKNLYTGSIPLSQLREQPFVSPNAGPVSRQEAEIRDKPFVLNYYREIHRYRDRTSEQEVRTEGREEDSNHRVHQSECRNLTNSATGPQQVEVRRRPFVPNYYKEVHKDQKLTPEQEIKTTAQEAPKGRVRQTGKRRVPNVHTWPQRFEIEHRTFLPNNYREVYENRDPVSGEEIETGIQEAPSGRIFQTEQGNLPNASMFIAQTRNQTEAQEAMSGRVREKEQDNSSNAPTLSQWFEDRPLSFPPSYYKEVNEYRDRPPGQKVRTEMQEASSGRVRQLEHGYLPNVTAEPQRVEVRHQPFVLNYYREVNENRELVTGQEIGTEAREEARNGKVNQTENGSLSRSATQDKLVGVRNKPFVPNFYREINQNRETAPEKEIMTEAPNATVHQIKHGYVSNAAAQIQLVEVRHDLFVPNLYREINQNQISVRRKEIITEAQAAPNGTVHQIEHGYIPSGFILDTSRFSGSDK